MSQSADDLGSEPTLRGPNPHENEPWLMPPPHALENPYEAPVGLDEPPLSALSVLLRVFLALLGMGALLISIFIAFFAACLAVGLPSNSFPAGILAGCVAAVVVGFFGARAYRSVYRRFNQKGADR